MKIRGQVGLYQGGEPRVVKAAGRGQDRVSLGHIGGGVEDRIHRARQCRRSRRDDLIGCGGRDLDQIGSARIQDQIAAEIGRLDRGAPAGSEQSTICQRHSVPERNPSARREHGPCKIVEAVGSAAEVDAANDGAGIVDDNVAGIAQNRASCGARCAGDRAIIRQDVGVASLQVDAGARSRPSGDRTSQVGHGGVAYTGRDGMDCVGAVAGRGEVAVRADGAELAKGCGSREDAIRPASARDDIADRIDGDVPAGRSASWSAASRCRQVALRRDPRQGAAAECRNGGRAVACGRHVSLRRHRAREGARLRDKTVGAVPIRRDVSRRVKSHAPAATRAGGDTGRAGPAGRDVSRRADTDIEARLTTAVRNDPRTPIGGDRPFECEIYVSRTDEPHPSSPGGDDLKRPEIDRAGNIGGELPGRNAGSP